MNLLNNIHLERDTFEFIKKLHSFKVVGSNDNELVSIVDDAQHGIIKIELVELLKEPYETKIWKYSISSTNIKLET